MNIDSILKFFVPKDNSFYPLFDDNAKILVKAAEQLKLLMTSEESDARIHIAARINELGKSGDEIAFRTYAQLNKSFVTPFERADIHELTCNINDVLDSINHISKSVGIYHIAKLDPSYYALAEIIFRTSLNIDLCLNLLKEAGSNKLAILKVCKDLRSLEEKSKETFYSGITDMLGKEKDITELIKNKEILENFERCTIATSAVTSTLKSILLTIQ
jgi:uncharacterized protein Yka (UPF0111/DUF47 family)